MALTPRGNFVGVIAGVLVATIVSFLVTMLILKTDKTKDEEDSFEENLEKSKQMKAEGKNLLNTTKFTKISYACDAGMGSSAMGATTFKRKLQKLGVDNVEIKNYRIEEVPVDSEIVVVHKDLAERMRKANPEIRIVAISNYLQDPLIDELVEEVLAVNKK